AVETPAFAKSRSPLEQLQPTEAKAKQAATHVHNLLTEIGNLERRRQQAREDYDQAMEELVAAGEAHEAAVLAYNKYRSPTAPEPSQSCSEFDFLVAFEEKLTSFSVHEYEDGEANTKLQVGLAATDEAKAQAKAVIQVSRVWGAARAIEQELRDPIGPDAAPRPEHYHDDGGAWQAPADRPSPKTKKPGDRIHVPLFFANITAWGPRIREFVVENKRNYGMMAFAETHVTDEKLERLKDPFRGWVATVLHLRAGNLIVISAYSLPKHGFGGLNL
ncbi:unnamed protein product, partial [Prorocentrum cordatum]